MRRRPLAAAAILTLCAALLTSCWDKTEINELALVSMVGLDRDPDTGLYTIWLQIVNPASGASAQGAPGGEQAPVYTYISSGKSFAEAQFAFYKLIPRRMFVHHAKAVLVSSRTAKRGMRDIMNYTELMTDARSSVPFLVTDGPIDELMRVFTPLERNPAESVTSRLKLLDDFMMMYGRRIEMRDVIERSAKEEIVVLPMIAPTARNDDAPNSWEVNAEIDANHNQFRISGGAIIRDYRMIGRLGDGELVLYNLLSGDKGLFLRRFPFRDGQVTVSMRSRGAKQKLEWRDGKPFIRIRIRLDLSTMAMSEFHPRTIDEIRELEANVNKRLAGEIADFLDKTRARGWDLLRVRSLLRRKAPNLANPDAAAREAEIGVEIESRLAGMGNLSRLYEGTGEKR